MSSNILFHCVYPMRWLLRLIVRFLVDGVKLEQWQHVVFHRPTSKYLLCQLLFHIPIFNLNQINFVYVSLIFNIFLYCSFTWGSCWMNWSMLALRAASIISSVETFSNAYAIFSAIVKSNKIGSWPTTPIQERSHWIFSSLISTSSTRYNPSIKIKSYKSKKNYSSPLDHLSHHKIVAKFE